jgi:uncharacterized protein YjcR
METNNENIAPEFKEYIDSRIIEIIDDTIQKIREILDQVEGLVHEIWDIIQIIAAMVHEAKKMFQSNNQTHAGQAA